ncbi:27580_t:CDS:2, partial [Dentiscutata erythropus]
VDTNATEDLVNATKNLVNTKENLYGSKLKTRAYDRLENTKDDCLSKCLRQETIISEENKKQPDANIISKADNNNFDNKDTERVEESYSSNYIIDISSESCSRQQTLSDSFLLPLLENYSHSYIIDLSPLSKIKGEFNDKQWAELVRRRPDAVRKAYYYEIEPIITHLFEQKVRIFRVRKNLAAPAYDNSFLYAEGDWEKIKHWREISVLTTQRCQNNDKNILTEQVEQSHQVDLLCNYEQYEVACVLACSGPYIYDLTKLTSDEFNLSRIMKDMLDDFESKFLYAGKKGLHPYIIGIQTYITEVRVYLMEKRRNVRGLINFLVWKLDTIDDDGFKTPPVTLSNNIKTQQTPPKQQKKKKAKEDLANATKTTKEKD